MAKQQFNFRLDPGLMARVDQARGDVTRTEFVERALKDILYEYERAARIDSARAIVDNPPQPEGMRPVPAWRRRADA